MSHRTDISFIDKPEILKVIFPLVYSPYYFNDKSTGQPADFDIRHIRVAKEVTIGCGFWAPSPDYPTILYFHGNGETIFDYRWSAQLYNESHINLFVVDYRGYGVSSGQPTVTSIIHDVHPIVRKFQRILSEEHFNDSCFIMGRSLGSISAIEAAYHHQDQFKGLIIESGTSSCFNKLWKYAAVTEKQKRAGSFFMNSNKIQKVHIPTIIIHGEHDQIVPVRESVELYEAAASSEKKVLIVPGADHNNLMSKGYQQYFSAINEFVSVNSITVQ